MKATGIVRKIDELGRIVIPMEIRRTLGIGEKDPIEIFVGDNEEVILKKYGNAKACLATGEISDTNKEFLDGKLVLSRDGLEQLAKEINNILQHA